VQIEVLDDDSAVARRAAAVIAADARAAVAARGRFCLAVSGGRTPWAMLRALADEDLHWAAVQLFQVDERITPAGDPDRNLTHIGESLLAHAPLQPAQVHALPVEAADPAARRATTARFCARCAARRRCWTWSTSAWVRTATPRRWCRATRCWA
jgi:6-phosphogluconolactonase